MPPYKNFRWPNSPHSCSTTKSAQLTVLGQSPSFDSFLLQSLACIHPSKLICSSLKSVGILRFLEFFEHFFRGFTFWVFFLVQGVFGHFNSSSSFYLIQFADAELQLVCSSICFRQQAMLRVAIPPSSTFNSTIIDRVVPDCEFLCYAAGS